MYTALCVCPPVQVSVLLFSIHYRSIQRSPPSLHTLVSVHTPLPYPPPRSRECGKGKTPSKLPFVNGLELLAEDGVIGDSTGLANAADLCVALWRATT